MHAAHDPPTAMFDIYQDFEDGAVLTAQGFDIILTRRSMGRLQLPTGRLVACDPFEFLDTEAFTVEFTPGDYPTRLIGAQLRDGLRPAYAVIELLKAPAARWVEAELPGDATRPWYADEESGHAITSSTACFMDLSTATRYLDYLEILPPTEDDEIARLAHLQTQRNLKKRANGMAWANVGQEILGGNLVLFEAEPDLYRTYIGYTEDDTPARVVTDLGVLGLRFPSFSMF